MKHILLFMFFFLSALSAFGSKSPLDSLLNALDLTIKERPQYNLIKEHKIDSLRIRLSQSTNLEDAYNIYHRLYREYRSYNMDSALSMANHKLDLANELKNKQYQYTANMNIAEVLGVMGMYKETFNIADGIEENKLDKSQLPYYYHLYHSTYTLLFENSLSQKEKGYYQQLVSQYKDSLLQVNTPGSSGYYLVENGKLVEEGKYDEALSLMQRLYNEYKENESMLGTLAYGLSDIYEKLDHTEEQKKYLAISAISDLKRAVKSYISLRKLAVILYKEGSLDRAYAYIKCSMEDATFSRARFRTLEISETLPIIVTAYDMKVTQEKANLKKYLILISILSIILIASLVYIYKQLKKLSKARKHIRDMYQEVKQMNADLNDLNKRLSESNLVKEEYIGYVFNLCSNYIDKMDTYRVNLNRKLKTGKIDEALKITNSTTLVSDELREFFGNFDIIFLNLYPQFVDEFNALLREEERIILKRKDMLTPDLRVFALIRLGINDSSKIASFLHYSPQTVYNYKLKMHNKLSVSKDEFSKKMQQIG